MRSNFTHLLTLEEDNVMNTPTVGLNRIAAAACAIAITAVSGMAFLSSTASSERDPFHFAAVMAANAKVQSASLVAVNNVPACWNETVTSARSPSGTAHICLRG
jgi:predicted dienelactone hydrolase